MKKTTQKKSIIILGAGFGGLAAAALLAKDGHQVTVLEKNEQPGGRASSLVAEGFRFDMGPSWYMMPEVFEKFFAEFGKSTSDYFELLPLKPQYRVFFGDKTQLDITGDIQKDTQTFEALEPGFTQKFEQYLAESKLKYDISMKSVLYKNMSSLFDLINLDMMKLGSKMGVFEPMHSYISKFFKHPKIQQILEYNLVFLGCSPKNAPSLFSLMTHVDFNLGVWYPEGGVTSLVNAVVSVGKEHGVTYVYNAPAQQLVVKDGKITAVVTPKKSYTADVIISNADYHFTESILSDQSVRTFSEKYWSKKVMTPSAFLLYLGVKGKLPKLEHHNLYFGDDWSKHFDDVFTRPRWPIDPSIYINKASQSDDTVAPKGHENLMVLVPIAPGLEENESWREHYAEYIIEFMEQKLDIKLKEKIVYQKIFSVTDFAERYNSYRGNALGGLAHTLFQSAIWRPNNFSKKIPNLFFVGANTVPGIGVPPAIISAHLVRDRLRDLESSSSP
jgi:phytoene desaturase